MRAVPKKGGRRRKSAGVPEYQLPLPLFEYGLQAAHQWPLVGDETKYTRGRRPAQEAWRDWPYIESNPPHAYSAMIFDIDDPDRWENEVDGPTPNWQVRKDYKPTTYHVAYTLEIPVARHDAARMKPLRFFRNVYDGLSVRIGADGRYSGLMTKNPLHPPPDHSVHWIRKAPYTLEELREWLPTKIPKPVKTTGVGRNCDLFDHCVKLAHTPRWGRDVIEREGHAGQWLDHVRLLNIQNYAENPLPDSECRSIAKSCAGYSLRQRSDARFSEIQTDRNTMRWHPGQLDYDYWSRAEEAMVMAADGKTAAEIAATFGVSVRTIRRDIAKVRKGR